uniref:Uncharacterized protein n=1 Tax=Cannabis sativa TaxID=3483 RepID=A0A803P4V7_CANSA
MSLVGSGSRSVRSGLGSFKLASSWLNGVNNMVLRVWTDIPEDILTIQVIAPPEDKTKGRPRTSRIASKGEFPKKQYNCGVDN